MAADKRLRMCNRWTPGITAVPINRFGIFLLIAIILAGCYQIRSTETVPKGIPEPLVYPSDLVSKEFLMDHLNILAGPSFMGRGTGQAGSQMAADYLYSFYQSEEYKKLEHFHVMRQSFELEGVFWDGISYTVYRKEGEDSLIVSESRQKPGRKAPFFPMMNGKDHVHAPVIFAGYGPFSNRYRNLELKEDELQDAWVMIFWDEEVHRDTTHPETDYGAVIPVTRKEIIQLLSGRYGAAGVIILCDRNQQDWDELAYAMSYQLGRPLAVRRESGFRGGMTSGGRALSIRPEKAAELLSLTSYEQLRDLREYWRQNGETGRPVHTGYWLTLDPLIETRTFEEENIIAVLQGADEELRSEHVLFTAHYDHMGTGDPDENMEIVYFGADDNASGTAVLMQIAEVFREASSRGYRPARTLVFLHTAAEEWGLHGARYYSNHPVFPLEEMAAILNIDMIGFVDNHHADEEDPRYLYIIGAGMVSSELEKMVDKANHSTARLVLDQRYNNTNHPSQLYRRSDHWVFAQKGIPFVFFFSGLHDYYHTTEDTPEKITWDLLVKRTALITEVGRKLADSQRPPLVDRQRFGRRAATESIR